MKVVIADDDALVSVSLKTILEAKGEIESFCQNKINAIANASLVEHREEFLKLENPVDIEPE